MAITIDLIISVEDLRYYCAINDSYDSEFLAPFIVQATDTISENVLGTALTEKLITDYNAETLAGVYETLYDSSNASVKKMVCWQTFVLALPRMALYIANGGITRLSGANGESATNQDISMLIRNAEGTLLRYENQVKSYLSQNSSDFTELQDNTPSYLRADLKPNDSSQGLSSTPNRYFSDY